MQAILKDISETNGIGTVAIRNIIQRHIPVSADLVRRWLNQMRFQKVLDYRDKRWYYVPKQDRSYVLTKQAMALLEKIPWWPSGITKGQLKKQLRLDDKLLTSFLTILYRKGKIDYLKKTKVQAGMRTIHFSWFFRIVKHRHYHSA